MYLLFVLSVTQRAFYLSRQQGSFFIRVLGVVPLPCTQNPTDILHEASRVKSKEKNELNWFKSLMRGRKNVLLSPPCIILQIGSTFLILFVLFVQIFSHKYFFSKYLGYISWVAIAVTIYLL